jgi:hypothetical protein
VNCGGTTVFSPYTMCAFSRRPQASCPASVAGPSFDNAMVPGHSVDQVNIRLLLVLIDSKVYHRVLRSTTVARYTIPALASTTNHGRKTPSANRIYLYRTPHCKLHCIAYMHMHRGASRVRHRAKRTWVDGSPACTDTTHKTSSSSLQ